MAPSLLVRVLAVTAIGFGVILGATAAAGTLAQEAPKPAQTIQDAPIAVTVTLAADGITASRTALVAGQPYRFDVTNMDGSTHSFVLEPAGARNAPLSADNKQAAAGGIAQGQTQRLEWTFAEPGDFQMADDRAAQSQSGMIAAFTVVPADTPVVPVQLSDFTVTPGTTKLEAGKLYLFEVTNTGPATHEFVLEPADAVDEPLARVAYGAKLEAEAEDVAPGQTADLLWTFPTAGPYQMACHVPGHFEAGMKATLAVS